MTDLEKFTQDELTIDTAKIQTGALLYFIPFALLFGIPYCIFWSSTLSKEQFKNAMSGFGVWKYPVLLGIVIAGIVVHELIHGITWAGFSKQGYRSIKYGMMWRYLTPYCHCSEPLFVKHYIIGALMPAIVLGIIPSIVSILIGYPGLFIFGMFFTMATGGDFMIVNLLKKESMTSLVQDHPSKPGCYIYRSKDS